MPRTADPILLTGASGYVGGRLLEALAGRGHEVRALSRRPDAADLPGASAVFRGDVGTGEGLARALDGCRTAYYLVHSMGDAADFEDEDRRGARLFATAAKGAGVERVIYLGGLGGEEISAHLRSRTEVAHVLAEFGPPLVHARAAMIVGTGSASFEIVRHLVDRLPAMIAPRWVTTRTQPIALQDCVDALVALAELDDVPQEVQLGGADVLTYRDMMRRYASVVGKRDPLLVQVPLFTPQLSSYWVALVTPVSLGLIKPLVKGLAAEMVVTQAPPPGVNDGPMGYDDAVRAAL